MNEMDEFIQGKHFSITDPQGVNTVIYQVNKTDKAAAKTGPKYTVERLDCTEELIGEKKKKTFYVDEPKPEGNELVILSFAKEKVVVNVGLLEDDTVTISKKPIPMKFDNIYNEEVEYREVEYTPNLKRPISIIDPETTEEMENQIIYLVSFGAEMQNIWKLNLLEQK